MENYGISSRYGYPPIKQIQSVGFEVVIHSWLKDEWHKPVFTKFRELNNDIITKPDFASKDENERRFHIWYSDRYPMFDNLLQAAEWHEVEIVKRDIERIYHCDCDEWRGFSYGTFQVARTINRLNDSIDPQREKWIKKMIEEFEEPIRANGLILIGTHWNSKLTIIEGNHRFTAVYSKIKDKEDETIVADRAYIGIHPDFGKYRFFHH